MKKLLYCAVAALTLSFAACNGTGAPADQPVSKALSDSLVEAFAKMAGSQTASNFNSAMISDSTISKADFIRGLNFALSADTLTSFNYGMRIGAAILGEMQNMRNQGIIVDEALLVNTFKQVFAMDDVDPEFMSQAQREYQVLNAQVQQAKSEYERRVKSNSPEALANVAAGKEYLAKMQAEDPEIKVTESGLGYKIINAGTDPKVAENNRIIMRYTGRFTNGEVFDEQNDEHAEHLSTMPVRALVPGFREGIEMLGTGGKATLYIPGELAYGVDGAPRANIGPLQMLVFDVEIVEIR